MSYRQSQFRQMRSAAYVAEGKADRMMVGLRFAQVPPTVVATEIAITVASFSLALILFAVGY